MKDPANCESQKWNFVEISFPDTVQVSDCIRYIFLSRFIVSKGRLPANFPPSFRASLSRLFISPSRENWLSSGAALLHPAPRPDGVYLISSGIKQRMETKMNVGERVARARECFALSAD